MFEKDISHIRDSITHGEFKKALELINEFEKKEFSPNEKDILNLLKSKASHFYGNHNLALELIDEVLPKFQVNDMPKYYLEAIAQKMRIHVEKSQLNEALDLVKQKEAILDSLSTEKLEELYKERFMLLHQEGIVNFHLGNFKRALKFTKEGLELADHYDYKAGIAIALLLLGDCHNRLGQGPKAVDFREESLRVFTELENRYWIAFVQHTLGHYYNGIGDYDKALECFLKIIPFVDKTENAYQKMVIFYHLSYTYEANLEPNIAYDYTFQAYQLLEKTDRLDMKKIILEKMVRMSIDRGEIEKADEYFEELKPFLTHISESNYDFNTRKFEIKKLMKELYEDNNALIREEVEGKVRDLLKDEATPENAKVGLLWELTSILLHEYISTGNNSIIDEIDSITSELLEITDIRFSEIGRISTLFFRIISLWLQAKIMGDDKKLEEIRLLLSKTEEYAGVKGNKLLLKSIKQAQEYYSSLMEELDDFVKSFATTK